MLGIIHSKIMEEESNLYLQLRAQKIARNQARLKELGLLRPQGSRAPVNKVQKPKKVVVSAKEATAPLRRSSRHLNRPTTYLELPEPKRSKHSGEARAKSAKARIVAHEATETKTFPAHSARSMNINVDSLVSGGLLGHVMERTGKAFVMEQVAQRSGIDVVNISFNKYSGVQDWKNDALFLWVNLGNGGDVFNDFLDGGRQVHNLCLSNGA